MTQKEKVVNYELSYRLKGDDYDRKLLGQQATNQHEAFRNAMTHLAGRKVKFFKLEFKNEDETKPAE